MNYDTNSHIEAICLKWPNCWYVYCRERNIVEQVNRISPRLLDGIKASSDSLIIGEIRRVTHMIKFDL